MTSQAVVQRILVFSSTKAIALPVVISMLAMIVLMLGIMIALIHKEGHQPSVHLVATNMPPDLTLDKGMKWHLL